MRNESKGEELRRVVRHLLSGCGSCVEVTRSFWRLGEKSLYRMDPGPRFGEPREALTEARALIRKGTVRSWSPDPEAAAQAIRWLEEGLALLEQFGEAADPETVAFGLHRLALLLTDGGRPEAFRVIRRARALYEALGDGPNLLRLRHLEGRAAVAGGDAEAAESAFLEAQQGFLLAGLGGEAAEVLFDRAIFYTRHGRAPEIHRLTLDLQPILRTRDIRQGVCLALLYFRRLVETEQATLDVLSEVARYVASLPRERRPVLQLALR